MPPDSDYGSAEEDRRDREAPHGADQWSAYRVIQWIRTQKQGCCELVLGLVMCLKASVSP